MAISGWQITLERCGLGAAAAYGFYLLARLVNTRWSLSALQKQLLEAQASLEHERVIRKADRVGRTRAEQELRAVKVQLQQLQQLQLQLNEQNLQLKPQNVIKPEAAADAATDGHPKPAPEAAVGRDDGNQGAGEQGGAVHTGVGDEVDVSGGGDDVADGALSADRAAAAAAAAALAAAGSALLVYPFRPIGRLQSVFSERNGTPRQPQLVPAARSRLVLSPKVPHACLEGLEQYSHCWVLYVFHANTDLAKYLSPDRTGLKAKIHVPRLNGGRMGVLATRSPHRPSPIGLSTAQIIRVQGNTLLLGGADIVDGSPVLDIKPYVPFCDCLTAARAPAWVQAEATDEPLAVGEVVIGTTAQAALLAAWHSRKAHSMYQSAAEYVELVRQVLSRDIRSLHQRLDVHPTRAAVGGTTNSSTAAPTPATQSQSRLTSGVATALTPPNSSSSSSGAADPAGGRLAPATSTATRASTPTGDHPCFTSGREGESEESTTAVLHRGGRYHVVLENIFVSYDIGPCGVVELRDAWVDSITAR